MSASSIIYEDSYLPGRIQQYTTAELAKDSIVIMYNNTESKTSGAKGVIGFDLDDTITVKGTSKLLPYRLEKLRHLHSRGWNIFVTTNQLKEEIEDDKLYDMLAEVAGFLKIPIVIVASRRKDEYHKPNVNSLLFLPKHFGKLNVFISSALGRCQGEDDYDKVLCDTLNLPLISSESYFYHHFSKLKRDEIHPSLVIDEVEILTAIILVGCPASGKTDYATNVLKKYKIIPRTSYMTTNKELIKKYLGEKKSIVIDNIHPDEDTRLNIISLLNIYGCRIVCIHFLNSIYHGKYYNSIRPNKCSNEAIDHFFEEFQSPTYDEGYDKIHVVMP